MTMSFSILHLSFVICHWSMVNDQQLMTNDEAPNERRQMTKSEGPHFHCQLSLASISGHGASMRAFDKSLYGKGAVAIWRYLGLSLPLAPGLKRSLYCAVERFSPSYALRRRLQ